MPCVSAWSQVLRPVWGPGAGEWNELWLRSGIFFVTLPQISMEAHRGPYTEDSSPPLHFHVNLEEYVDLKSLAKSNPSTLRAWWAARARPFGMKPFLAVFPELEEDPTDF